MPPILLGSVLGLIATATLMGRMISILYRPSAADASYVVVALVVLLLCALFATLVPAGRAARVSPSEAIRTD